MGDGGAATLHAEVERAFNAGDVDALVALYVDDACMVQPDGTSAHGLDAIRASWQQFATLGGTISMTTNYVFEVGDMALLSNAWQFKAGDMEFGASSAEVAVRTGDGWRYVIDNPFGGAPPE